MNVFALLIAMLIALGSVIPLASAAMPPRADQCCCATDGDTTSAADHDASCSTDCSVACAPCCAGVALMAIRSNSELLRWPAATKTVYFESQAFADATAMSPPVPPPRA